MLGGKFATAAQIEQLSKTPPKEVLLAQIIGAINSPASGVVGVLNGVMAQLVRAIQAIADQKEAAA